jgi:PAS domain S-box-containing protein
MIEIKDMSIIIPYTNQLTLIELAVLVFSGILISLLFYSLNLFLYLKNKFYFFSFIYIISILFFVISITGVGDKYLWFEIDLLKKLSFSMSLSFFVICSTLFLNKKMNTKNHSKKMNNVFYYYISFPVFVLILNFFNYKYSIYLAPILLISYLCIILIGCIYSLTSKLYKLNLYLVPKILTTIFICSYLFSLFYLNKINLTLGIIVLFSFLTEIYIIIFLINKKFEKILLDKVKIKKESLILESKFKELLEVTFDCFWQTNQFGEIVFISNNIYEKLGYKKDEIKLKKLDDLFAKNAPNELKIQFRAIMSKKNSYKNIEVVSVTKSGEFKWFKVNGIVRYNEKNEFTGYIGALIDETYDRHKQYELFVNNNTKSLARIAGAIAHEINNPLTYILLCIDSFLGHQDSFEKVNFEKSMSKIQEMKKKTLKITKIVSKLQGLSLQGVELIKIDCKLSEIIDMAIKFCQYELKSLNIPYSIELEENEKFVNVKKEEIYKALVNLIHNSIEATDNIENPWIKISLKNEDDNYITLSVMDNGEGIPLDKRASIFEPFYTTKDFKKTGLGLTQSYQFVERNHGVLSLDLQSEFTKFSMKFKTIEK